MPLPVGQVSRVFRSYINQERIAELNKKSGLKTVQRQSDQVSISSKGRELLKSSLENKGNLSPNISSASLKPSTNS